MEILLCLLVIVAGANARPQFGLQNIPRDDDNRISDGPYSFHYTVAEPKNKTYFGQKESGDLENTKIGSYYVLLPNGKVMYVQYRADKTGFHPKISFSNTLPPDVPSTTAITPYTPPTPTSLTFLG